MQLAHIAIAVFDLEAAKRSYENLLATSPSFEGEVAHEGVRYVFFHVGNTKIELIAPLDESSPLHRFLNKRGEGVHHIAFTTDSLEAAKKRLDPIPFLGGVRAGAEGCNITFLPPKDLHGVLVELMEKKP